MKIKGNRFVTSILAASMLSGTFFVPASAGELEGESAIAGMAVTLNNYYAGEETPDEAILDYLVPLYCAVGLPRPAMIYMFFPPSATGDRDGGIKKAIAAASLSPMALMLVQFIIRSLIPSESASACRSKSSGTVIPFTGSGLRLSKTSYTSNRSLVSTFSG